MPVIFCYLTPPSGDNKTLSKELYINCSQLLPTEISKNQRLSAIAYFPQIISLSKFLPSSFHFPSPTPSGLLSLLGVKQLVILFPLLAGTNCSIPKVYLCYSEIAQFIFFPLLYKHRYLYVWRFFFPYFYIGGLGTAGRCHFIWGKLANGYFPLPW